MIRRKSGILPYVSYLKEGPMQFRILSTAEARGCKHDL